MTNKETVTTKNNNPTSTEENTVKKNSLVEETKQELAKVVWPSRQQLLSESVAVILMVAVIATLIYLVDQLFGWGAGRVF